MKIDCILFYFILSVAITNTRAKICNVMLSEEHVGLFQRWDGKYVQSKWVS